MWAIYAVLSAFFAACTSILAKIGVEDVNSNLATAIRTVVVLVLAWIIVFATGKQVELQSISKRSILFLILSGLATGLSWICYYRALQMGNASRVMPIDKSSVVMGIIMAFLILKEPMNLKTAAGGVLITAGTLILAL